ncbi:shikimate dehydrogenase [Pseudaquidulcibacter saccharophilus]|uniref:shikimate dehydrogenase n=1 Tax=Pseudaquidulcibacter saccharophilus TaxID=2831900 RepID=UPI001EFF162A|nr:shikimate dehydrogenase [Pseudaquidulcibacter saccharophilus]
MSKIKASTELYGIFGYPAKHSLSPILQNGWINDFGINAVFVGLEVKPQDFAEALNGLKKVGFKGGNITAPLKEDIAKLVAFPSHEVKTIGAANTIRAKDDDFEAINTDGIGLTVDLDYNFKGWRSACKIIAIIGAGGAARGVISALLSDEVREIRFVGRTISKCEELANIGRILAGNRNITFSVFGWDEMAQGLSGASLVINATTLGLKGVGALDVDLSPTTKDAIIYDMVYMPTPTAFTIAANNQKRRGLNGLGMLAGQGVLAFEFWFGSRPDFMRGLERLKAQLK